MKKIEIAKTFIEDYLTCGQTYDNFIFENCPIEFIYEAQKLLRVPENGIKPCNVTITREDEINLEKTLENCENSLQRDCFTRDFVTALVMKEVLKDIPEKGATYGVVCEQIKAYMENEFCKVKQYYVSSFFPSDVADYSRKYGKIELNFFLINTQNVALQTAINNFIGSREPYSIKLFTTNERLPSYYDQAGNIMQAPHDFMTRNVNNFITVTDECESLI